MDTDAVANECLRKSQCDNSKLCRYFYLLSLVGLVVILIVAGLVLRHVVRGLVILEAEKDAIMIARVARDCEIRPYVARHYRENGQFLTIPLADTAEVDIAMRAFVTPFNIVKIKIYNTEPRVIYSTDHNAIGKMDTHNEMLITALTGRPVSVYESKDKVWDLGDEARIDVEMIESYVPVYGPDGKLMGSFEIYRDATPDLRMADAILLRAWAILAVTVVGVFASLMYVIHRAAATIDSHAVELAASNSQLLNEADERKRLERELLGIVERERQRIGQELHDSIGQQFVGISFMLETLEDKLEGGSESLEKPYVDKIIERVKQAAVQTRDLARGLDPMHLDTNGLVAALEELAANAEQMFGISCTVECETPVHITDLSVATNVYRIAQEAVTNAVKHGKADIVKIGLVAEDGSLILIAENDGLDFETDSGEAEGMGLKIMQYRAEAMNSTLDVRKGAAGGAIVTCVFPNRTQTILSRGS